jgi:hypothetical protein
LVRRSLKAAAAHLPLPRKVNIDPSFSPDQVSAIEAAFTGVSGYRAEQIRTLVREQDDKIAGK